MNRSQGRHFFDQTKDTAPFPRNLAYRASYRASCWAYYRSYTRSEILRLLLYVPVSPVSEKHDLVGVMRGLNGEGGWPVVLRAGTVRVLLEPRGFGVLLTCGT